MKNLTDFMKKTVVLLVMTAMLSGGVFLHTAMTVSATESNTGEQPDVEELLSGVEEKVSEALSKIDKEKVGEIFDFVKEKAADGSLSTEDGLKNAIEEAEQEFGVTIDKSVAAQVVDVMETLEEMGFSGEDIIEKAQNLYDTYGADFMAHANEAFTEVVEDAVENAVTGFFRNLWEGIKTSVGNFLESWP